MKAFAARPGNAAKVAAERVNGNGIAGARSNVAGKGSVKAAAGYIAGTNADDGVVEAIERFVLQ